MTATFNKPYAKAKDMWFASLGVSLLDAQATIRIAGKQAC